MNKIILLISLLITLIGCKNKNENTAKNNQSSIQNNIQESSRKQIETKEKVETYSEYKTGNHSTNGAQYYYKEVSHNNTIRKVMYDYLDIDSLKINGSFKQYSKIDMMLDVFGKPDSSKIFEGYESIGTYYFYDFARMKMYNNDSLIYCSSMEFISDNLFIKYDSLKYDSSTNLESFAKRFPLSYLNREVNRHYKETKGCEWIRLTTKQDFSRGDEFIFIFYEKQLKYFSYFDGND